MLSTALEKRIKRQIIGKPHRFLAIVPLGFEQTLVQELLGLGLDFVDDEGKPHAASDGKVEFTVKITEAWKAVAYSRIANRILMHVDDFKAENFRDLEKKAAEIPWELYLAAPPDQIHVTCKHSRLYHSDAVAERLQKTIGGSLPLAQRHPGEGREQHSLSEPLLLHVTLIDDRCTIWLDLSGEELYKRGHERFVNDAPLKETIAAAMLFEASGVAPSKEIAVFDLMAGSGTFSLEAAYMANGLIPGKCRDFALKHQPAFKEATWNFITRNVVDGDNGAKQSIAKIITSDISPKAVEIIKHNVECSPLAGIEPALVSPLLRDFFDYTAQEIANACQAGIHSDNSNPSEASPVIVLNPPYGKRLDFDAPKLYTRLGRRLAELAHALQALGQSLTVAILAPKDDNRPGSAYTCTANLLRECPGLSPEHNPAAKCIATSHGGFSLNVFIAKI
ncbi:class I SAM-dependent RNA methyltransferase [Fibrobacter succinogenes]|uniref:THUMP domain-containing class I SAM-dependent RNA methyltransferase n=1 Tax=Fibrobacter succinogenes TaxID=833 RepID=UPI0013CF6E48|nr:RNA methyltransferase [Fibrobacter succinogenes]